MPSYSYPNDGKLHTRRSELLRCGKGVNTVAEERSIGGVSLSGGHLDMGDYLHRQYQEESLQTGKIPAVFHEVWLSEVCSDPSSLEIDEVELHVENEILPGIVLHSTVDAYKRGKYIIDYKTTIQEKEKIYLSNQGALYAWQCGVKDGVTPEKAVFLYVQYDRDQLVKDDEGNIISFGEPVRYFAKIKDITGKELTKVKQWSEERAIRLRNALVTQS